MIKIQHISRIYQNGTTKTSALKDIDFKIKPNEVTIILGPSGSGKSTTLNILGGMDRPTSGQIFYDDRVISNESDKALTDYRRKIVGFVFQFYNLVSNLTVRENIEIAAKLTNNNQDRVNQLIQKVGLENRQDNFPDQLSGGEMQRVAIARALAKEPALLLCDEPTGALDSKTSQRIFQLLKDSCSPKTAVVIVTHNSEVAPIGNKIVHIKDGKISEITNNPHPVAVSEVNWS
ncbi:MAG: ABC transporter ATP-binding protein [Liquorilactobacillus ghanensis]|uniref:ABC transporter ATP-binding protein n=1 Tax=Liquorilactobacillus ghanensis TaxID=399370 RepID=UPI0039E95509